DPDGVVGAAYLPTDGWLDPSSLTFALAEGARRGGATIRTGIRVTGIDVERGRVRGVQTSAGPVRADVVVNAAGMWANEVGAIAGADGVGRIMAEWIVDGEPSMDAWKMDIRRFGAHYSSRRYTLARATEIYSTYYDIHYPGEERSSARGLRLPPTYERLAALGCEFGEKSGWERPNWFRRNADEAL